MNFTNSLNHKGTHNIETERLILRTFKIDDAQDMFCNWASDDKVTQYLTWPTHQDVSISQKIVDMWIAEYDKPTTYRWGITLKDNGDHVIGCIDVVDLKEEMESAEIGYALSARYWNKGIMSEALKAVIDYLLTCGFGRISARHASENPASGRVMQKSGMIYEGTLKRFEKNKQGEFIDMVYYATTK